ncbi:MAG: aldolase [Rhodobacterales bacterium]|nr:MAG: aldolase [Rhodobacterales bacterium]
MTTFDDRESAFESKFAHDEEMQFKAEARANRKLAEWAGALLGKTADDMEGYVREVIRADFEEAGHEDVLRKVTGDLGDKSDAATVRAKRAECLAKAKAELIGEG